MKLYSNLYGLSLPFYLDPSVIGMVLNVIAMIIGSALTQVENDEVYAREKLFVLPEEEKDIVEIKRTLTITKYSVLLGIAMVVILLILWVISYLKAL
ncbi:MAG: hypothetical protein HFJ03_12570 [Lachnospira sp.]|nr:hypothetical protein [Lachnospira sp.]